MHNVFFWYADDYLIDILLSAYYNQLWKLMLVIRVCLCGWEICSYEEEKQVVLDAIMSKYLVAGFTTVTSVSVIIAGVFETFIVP